MAYAGRAGGTVVEGTLKVRSSRFSLHLGLFGVRRLGAAFRPLENSDETESGDKSPHSK
jgi:hypothetical protein